MLLESLVRCSRWWAIHLGRSVLVLAVLAVTSTLAMPYALGSSPCGQDDTIGAATQNDLPAENEDTTPDVPEERDDDERDDEDPELGDAVLASEGALDRSIAWAPRARAARAPRSIARGARGAHARTIERPPHA